MRMLRALAGRPPEPAGGGAEASRWAVIDVGSSSLRLVVWSGPARLPTMILNEKVVANLGRTLATDGKLPRKAMTVALQGLARFALLVRELDVRRVRLVATAAVRDADNGAAFLDRVRALGLEPELLTGEQEAQASASGIRSAFPDADGIVGDLGGGSLELVAVGRTGPAAGDSFPWGTLRLDALRQQHGTLDAVVREQLTAAGWVGRGRGRPFYLVGGSWRALTRVAMHQAEFPLADPHGYAMDPAAVPALAETLAGMTGRQLRAIPGLPSSRVATLPDSAALLAAVVRQVKPARLVTSAFGLREGLLYDMLDRETRAQDPVFVAIAARGAGSPERLRHGEALAAWIAPLFQGDGRDGSRLRRATCLLAGLVEPGDGRARRIWELLFSDRWIALDTAQRATIAAALFAEAGERTPPAALDRLGDAADLARARTWGQAMRLARKLGATATGVLTRSGLRRGDGQLVLMLEARLAALYTDNVAQQHATLAAALDLVPGIQGRD